MPIEAPTMDVLRKQAIAMAMLWLTARDYQHEGGRAWFHVRASDLGLRDDVLAGKRIRVTIDAEPDGVPANAQAGGSPQRWQFLGPPPYSQPPESAAGVPAPRTFKRGRDGCVHCGQDWIDHEGAECACPDGVDGVLTCGRVLDAADPFCPKCGHNRDASSVSSVDEGAGRHSCQKCGAEWRERTPGVKEVDSVQAERERCAAIADDEARIREEAGKKHPEDSEGRGRCFAAARAAANVARGIRSGEVVAGVPATPFVPCPVCGGEAIHAHEMLVRTFIKLAPGVQAGASADPFDALPELYVSEPTAGRMAGKRLACDLNTGRVLGVLPDADGVKGRVTLSPEGEATVPGAGVEFAMQCLARADALLQGVDAPSVVVHSAAHELHHALKVLRTAGVKGLDRG